MGLGCPQEPAFLCPGAPPRLGARWEAQHGTGRDSSPGGPCVGVLPRLRIRAISHPLRQALRKHTSPPYSCPLFEVPSVCASVAGSLSPGMGLALDRRGGGIIPEPPQVTALSAHLEMKTSRPRPLQGCSSVCRVGNSARLHTCHRIT